MKFSLSPSVTLVPGHNATFAITGLSCYHRRAFANNSSKDLYAMDILAPLCTDSHPNTIVTRRTSPLRSAKLYIRDYIYRFARLLALLLQHKREATASTPGGPLLSIGSPACKRRLSKNAAVKESRTARTPRSMFI